MSLTDRLTENAPSSISAASVRHGDDLQVVSVRVVPVEAASTVVGVDLALGPMERVGPEGEPALDDPGLDLVELVLAHHERIMLRMDLAVVVGVIHRYAVVDLDDDERPVRRRLRQPQDLDEELRRRVLVGARDDGVVELDGHGWSFPRRSIRRHSRPPARRATGVECLAISTVYRYLPVVLRP